ncbi:hypothetical protein D5086_002927 [Populus alba]|uniref:Uncharacterized protein n=1 Tax=Populus alba TaxID=43335 RepID=A0ACC4D4Q6_POPAL
MMFEINIKWVLPHMLSHGRSRLKGQKIMSMSETTKCKSFGCNLKSSFRPETSGIALHISNNYDVESDYWSASAMAWTWAAYCKFQRTSSKDGRVDGSGDMHLLVMETKIDNEDSCEQVVKNNWIHNFFFDHPGFQRMPDHL